MNLYNPVFVEIVQSKKSEMKRIAQNQPIIIGKLVRKSKINERFLRGKRNPSVCI